MNGRCETDPLDPAIDVCDRCYGEFCSEHLVYPKGRKLPFCTECVLVASGVRGTVAFEERGSKRTAKKRRAELKANGAAEAPVFEFFDAGREGSDQTEVSEQPGTAPSAASKRRTTSGGATAASSKPAAKKRTKARSTTKPGARSKASAKRTSKPQSTAASGSNSDSVQSAFTDGETETTKAEKVPAKATKRQRKTAAKKPRRATNSQTTRAKARDGDAVDAELEEFAAIDPDAEPNPGSGVEVDPPATPAVAKLAELRRLASARNPEPVNDAEAESAESDEATSAVEAQSGDSHDVDAFVEVDDLTSAEAPTVEAQAGPETDTAPQTPVADDASAAVGTDLEVETPKPTPPQEKRPPRPERAPRPRPPANRKRSAPASNATAQDKNQPPSTNKGVRQGSGGLPMPNPTTVPPPRRRAEDREGSTGPDQRGTGRKKTAKRPTAPMIGDVRTIGGRRRDDEVAAEVPNDPAAVDEQENDEPPMALNAVEAFDSGRPKASTAAAKKPSASTRTTKSTSMPPPTGPLERSTTTDQGDESAETSVPEASQKADTDADGTWIPPILRGMAPDAREAKADLPSRRRKE